MTDLSEFLLARIAEDEEAVTVARAYATGPMGGSVAAPAIVIVRQDGYRLWSTDQLLAECEAKRRIVAELRTGDPANRWANEAWRQAESDVLHLLALPHADHPDFREVWRP